MIFDTSAQLALTPLALRKARERAGLSQEEVAARCPISLPAIQNYECPGHRPNYSYLLMLLEAYGLDLGGFYSLLTEVFTDRQHAELHGRVSQIEEQVKALAEAVGMQATTSEDVSPST